MWQVKPEVASFGLICGLFLSVLKLMNILVEQQIRYIIANAWLFKPQ